MDYKHFIYKIMVIGDPLVGKTSLIRRYIENTFSDEYQTTLGVDFLKKDIWLSEDTTVTLILWDVAGQAKFASFKHAYYTGSDFIIIAFDITNVRSYHSVDHWLREAQKILGDGIEFAIFANKVDLEEQRAISNYNDFKNIPTVLDIVETSAKTGYNVTEVFWKVAKFLLSKKGYIVEE